MDHFARVDRGKHFLPLFFSATRDLYKRTPELIEHYFWRSQRVYCTYFNWQKIAPQQTTISKHFVLKRRKNNVQCIIYIFSTYQQIAKTLPLDLVTETCLNFCTVPWEKKDKSGINYFICTCQLWILMHEFFLWSIFNLLPIVPQTKTLRLMSPGGEKLLPLKACNECRSV